MKEINKIRKLGLQLARLRQMECLPQKSEQTQPKRMELLLKQVQIRTLILII